MKPWVRDSYYSAAECDFCVLNFHYHHRVILDSNSLDRLSNIAKTRPFVAFGFAKKKSRQNRSRGIVSAGESRSAVRGRSSKAAQAKCLRGAHQLFLKGAHVGHQGFD